MKTSHRQQHQGNEFDGPLPNYRHEVPCTKECNQAHQSQQDRRERGESVHHNHRRNDERLVLGGEEQAATGLRDIPPLKDADARRHKEGSSGDRSPELELPLEHYAHKNDQKGTRKENNLKRDRKERSVLHQPPSPSWSVDSLTGP